MRTNTDGSEQDLKNDLEQCSIHHWFPRLRATSIRTTLIPLDDAVVRYLTADGVFVPDVGDADDDTDEDDDANEDDGWDEVEDEASHECLPAFEAAITAAISKHGDACFPKLNWSAPTDAAWVLGGSLKCASARDVLLLLKSSDRVAHDLCEARRAHGGSSSDEAAGRFPWTLALRSWCNLRPSSEFRCFGVAHGAVLVAACQRDRFSHYPFLQDARSTILDQLRAFAARALGGSSARGALPARVVWDAYIDANDHVHLIDMSPFHAATDPLVYQWEELTRLAEEAEARDAGAAASAAAGGRVRVALNVGASPAGCCVRATLQAATASAAAAASVAEDVPPELRLVAEHGVAPSAQMYYGMPHDLREVGGTDLRSLLEAARAASQHATTASKAQGG